MRTYAGAKSLDSQENGTSTPVANKEGKGTLRPECAHFEHFETEQKPSQNGRYLDALVAHGYPFTGKEPKKILGIRLYKMSGVQVLGSGLFQAK